MTGPDSTQASGGREAVLLFAHGSRDAAWARPFERLRALIAAQGVAVELAYLERMTPDLAGAAGALAAQGCSAAVVVPVFLGQGSHVREDLPALVEAARREHPERRAAPRGADWR